MTTRRGTDLFTAEEVAYLITLPVVRNATANRIIYTEEFKIDVLSRYLSGESPTVIFRQAGLDPTLIGAKRIERCVARWRQTPELAAKANNRMLYDDVFHGAPPPGRDVPAQEDDLPAPDPGILDAAQAAKERLTLSRDKRFDLRDLIIYQQALHIGELERELNWYRSRSVPPANPS